jgi:hypothetical protein
MVNILPYDITGLCRTPDLSDSSANCAEMPPFFQPLLRIRAADVRPGAEIRASG